MYVRRSASDHAPDGTSSATDALFLRFGLALIESVNARATFLPAGGEGREGEGAHHCEEEGSHHLTGGGEAESRTRQL